LSLLSPEPTGLTGRLDRGLLDVGDCSFELVGIQRADGDESRGAEDPVAGGQVGFLLEDVVELGTLVRVLDLADPLPLGRV
jgi:hypothetical protein